ncbi:AROS regulator, partial [Nothocercus nigrocapillus]|nr:AROS regulator [Nothocercus nigrocapillus]
MSASLLRRGLELLEAPGSGGGAGPGRAGPGVLRARRLGNAVPVCPTGRGKAPRGPGGPRAAGTAKRRKAAPGPARSRATVKGRAVKSAIEEYCKKKAVDHLKANLLYMTSGRYIADKAVTQQVLAQNSGRKSKDRPPEKKEEKKEKKKSEGTVFTEEDFRKFEREYFGTA